MIAGLVALVLAGATPQMPLSLSTTDDALAVFANPAALGVRGGAQFCYLYNFRTVLWSDFFSNNTFVAKAGPLGVFWEPEPSKYGLALGGGGGGVFGGLRFTHDTVSRWDLGVMARPARWLSVGGLWTDLNHEFGALWLSAAVRPLGDRVSLFGESQLALPLRPVVGIEVEPLDGLKLAARVLLRERLSQSDFVAGVTLGLGRGSVGAVGTGVGQEVGGVVSFATEARRTFLPRQKRCLDVKLSGPIADQKPGFSLFGGARGRTTWSLLDFLNRAAQDPRVTAMVLDLSDAELSLTQAQEVRDAVGRFKAGGRRVFAYSPGFGMGTYYVASVADRIITHPLGGVAIPGVSGYAMFLKGALDKLGLKADYTRHGKYKSAVETLTEDSLTAPNREQLTALVDGMFEDFVGTVSGGRRFSKESLEALIDVGWFTTPRAMVAGLVDTFCYRDELDSLLEKDLGRTAKVSEKRFMEGVVTDEGWQEKPAIAVVYATGQIADGESRTDFLTGEATMGARTMAKAIKAAAKDRRVKAILLRIDSPGGDGYASDLIWHELERAKARKPVVVSMAGVAGSGGYYIACNASRIFALPGTITGSIGVFGLKFVTEGLYGKLGVRRQVIKRGEHADANSDAREWTPAEESLQQAMVDEFYEGFVGRVAKGRHMTAEQVDSIGQGRVWSGTDGKRVGIVDELGGMLAAVEYAKKAAKLKDCDLVFYPRPGSGLGANLSDFAQDQLRKVIQ